MASALEDIKDVVFLRLVLFETSHKDSNLSAKDTQLSSNTYWLSSNLDTLAWDNSNWYYTPVSEYSDYTALNKLPAANVSVSVTALSKEHSEYESSSEVQVTLENHSSFSAFFISLNLVDEEGKNVVPVIWEDNYLTLWPREEVTVQVRTLEGAAYAAAAVKVVGKNVKGVTVMVG